MGTCTENKIATCDNNVSALEIFRGMLKKVSGSDCPVIPIVNFVSPAANVVSCDKNFSLEEVIKDIALAVGTGALAVSHMPGDYQDRITCDDIPDIKTLINEVYAITDDCNAIRKIDTVTDLDCMHIRCTEAQEPLLNLILKTFVRDAITGLTSVLVIKVEASDFLYIDCESTKGEDIYTTIRKLLFPSLDFPGHFAWMVNVSEIAESVCYVFTFDATGSDNIGLITYNGGAQFINLNINIGDFTLVEIILQIKQALSEVITYDDVFLTLETDGDGDHYTLTIENPSVIFSALVVSGHPIIVEITDCN